jgi:circadian clock protein KaiC
MAAGRVKTGIKGLDKALNGGFPEGNMVLVSGGAGTGKSTLCMQFLINGAKMGEKSLYITTEQTRSELDKQAKCYGWNLKQLESKGKLRIFYLDVNRVANFLDSLMEEISTFKPKRIAVDSLTTLTDNLAITDFRDKTGFSMVQVMENVYPTPLSEKIITKNVLYSLINKLKHEVGVTTLLTTELYEHSQGLSADGVSEFIVDGVIKLSYLGVGLLEFRSMQIRKMRYTGHKKKFLGYEISNNGIQIIEEKSL